MKNISAAQYIIWRRVYINVQNNLRTKNAAGDKVNDGQVLIKEDGLIGIDLQTDGDISEGPTAKDVWKDANNLDTSVPTASIKFWDKSHVTTHTVDNVLYYYFPVTITKTGTITTMSQTFYTAAGGKDTVAWGNIVSGGTYYVRFTQDDIDSGRYRYYVSFETAGGYTYKGKLAILRFVGDGQNLILARANREQNTAFAQDQPPDISSTLTINKIDADVKNKKLSATVYIQAPDGTWVSSTSGDYSNNPVSITVPTTGITITGLKKYGNYTIYEVAGPSGYILGQQDNYDASKGWAVCGTVNVPLASDKGFNAENDYYILGLRGYVWVDRGDATKTANESGYDYLYNSGETRFSGIKVELVNKTNNTVAYTATTNNNGEYQFNFAARTIKYWDLKNYYVRFTYDNTTYVTVPVNLTAGTGSKAIENQIDNADLDDNQLTGTSGNNPGQAITYPSATNEQNSLARYYNTGNYYVENVNLGLMEKPPTDYYVSESIEYVKIVRGNYSFRYSMGDKAVVDVDGEQKYQEDLVSTVSMQRDVGFTQALYPSDIVCNMSDDRNLKGDYQVYVVYRIDVTNNTTTYIDNLYSEQRLKLESLTNSYERNKYELVTDTNIANNLDYKISDGNKNAINDHFDDWTDNGDGTASLKIGESAYKNGK